MEFLEDHMKFPWDSISSVNLKTLGKISCPSFLKGCNVFKINVLVIIVMVTETTNYKKIAFFLASIVLLGSCAKERSTKQQWKLEYNNYENGGFEKFDAKEQETGPGLVFIEGGTFTMGSTEEDVMNDLEQ